MLRRVDQRLLLMILTLAVAGLLVAALVSVNKANDTAAQIKANQYAGCVRGNEVRQQQLFLFDALIAGNRARISAWQARPHDTPPFTRADRRQANANRRELILLQKAELGLVETQNPISAHPNSADLHRRAIVDCSTYFPP